MTPGANALDISSPIRDFVQQCKEWQNYDENLHSIRVKHVRRYVDRLSRASVDLLLKDTVMIFRRTSLDPTRSVQFGRKRRQPRNQSKTRRPTTLQIRNAAYLMRAWTYVAIRLNMLIEADLRLTSRFKIQSLTSATGNQRSS